MKVRTVPVGQIAKIFGIHRNAVAKWRARYSDFPYNYGIPEYPLYDPRDVIEWYADRWPKRLDRFSTHLYHYRIKAGTETSLSKTQMGPFSEAKGYLQAIRDLEFKDWRVYFTKTGFSAHKGDEIEVLVLDISDLGPDPWYAYDARFKKGKI